MGIDLTKLVHHFKTGSESPAVEIVTAGIALLIAQSVIVANPFYDEKEISKFLKLRRTFHKDFAEACSRLADEIEEGKYGAGPRSAAAPLRSVSHMGANQSRQALVQVVRLLRGMRQLRGEDVSMVVLRLIREANYIGAADERERPYAEDYTEFFRNTIKLESVPAPLKSLLRKVIQIGRGTGKTLNLLPHEDENPGAWFEMDEAQKSALKKKLDEAEATIQENHMDKTPEERQALWTEASATIKKVLREAGVHRNILKSEDKVEDIETILKRESKMETDGAVEYLVKQLSDRIEKWGLRDRKNVSMEVRKVLNQLKKVSTFDTAQSVLNDAIRRNVIDKYLMEDIKSIMDGVQKNKAVAEGIPLVPLHFKPMTVDEFRSAHDTGEVRFDDGISEDKRKEILGRVSRGISDLEGIFGKGFCGKHKKKLEFHFQDYGMGAQYFAWGDKKGWQPRVTFSEEYEGLVAHELSHYFEDLISFRLEKATSTPEKNQEREERGRSYGGYVGPGNLFANTGVSLRTVIEDKVFQRTRDDLAEHLPEALELIQTIVGLPDFERWEDMISSAFETALPRAVQNLTGMSIYDLPKDHPYYKAERATRKSDWPPELLKEVERVYADISDGDTRKLSYKQSATEVWARTCEQYVYTKLSRAGVVNPWLNQLSYDDDDFIESKTFESKIEPIFDRLFAKLGTRNILAAVLRRMFKS